MTATKRKPQVAQLETIIARLEAWQARNSHSDETGLASAAKSKLMELVRILDAAK